MMKNMRSDSTLASLSPVQRDLLFDWIKCFSYVKAQEMAARPLDEGGFNLEINRTSLVRFFLKRQKEEHRQELAEIAAAALENADIPAETKILLSETRANFAHFTYELSKEADVPANYDRIAATLHRIDTNALREKELLIDQERVNVTRARAAQQQAQFEFDISAHVLKHAAELLSVLKNSKTDTIEKIKAAREICFGPAAASATQTSRTPAVTHSDTLRHNTNVASPSTTCSELESGHSSQESGETPACPNATDPESLTHCDTLRHTTEQGTPQTPNFSAPESSESSQESDVTPTAPNASDLQALTHSDTHLNSRSERPSVGNIIEARLGSERHTTADAGTPPSDAAAAENENFKPSSHPHCDIYDESELAYKFRFSSCKLLSPETSLMLPKSEAPNPTSR